MSKHEEDIKEMSDAFMDNIRELEAEISRLKARVQELEAENARLRKHPDCHPCPECHDGTIQWECSICQKEGVKDE